MKITNFLFFLCIISFFSFIVDRHHRGCCQVDGLGHSHFAKQAKIVHIASHGDKFNLQIRDELIQHQLHLVCHIRCGGSLVGFDQPMVTMVEQCRLNHRRANSGTLSFAGGLPRLAVLAPSGRVGRFSVAGTISGGKLRYSRKKFVPSLFKYQ